MSIHSAIVQNLPDIHRWVEARALLLSGSCEIFGFRKTPALSVVLREPKAGTLFVIGTPDARAVEAALNRGPLSTEVIVAKAHASELEGMLSEWSRTMIVVHRLQHPDHLPNVPVGAVRFLDPAELPRLLIDSELKQELEAGAEGSPIAATVVGEQPVSFCYAGAVTETLWDVAIDTLEAHRRLGYAGLCVTHLIRHMQTHGKEPVWQSAEDNPPSWRLAAKLGFELVDELVWFERRKRR